MSENTERGRRILDEVLDRGDPNTPAALKKKTRAHENAIQGFLLFCGILSIFTTIGIILILGRESFAFFSRQVWEETNKTLVTEIDRTQSEFRTSTSGAGLSSDAVIRISNEIMYVETYDSNRIEVESTGTGGGFNLFCSDDETLRTDINDASRPITDAEREQCNNNGIEPLEIRIGTDALAITVNPANDFVDNVTVGELALIFGEAQTWADIRPEWPNEPIQRFIPGTDSGTFDYFVDEVFEGDESRILNASNEVTSEDDNQLTRNIQQNEYAVGFFGYAYYADNQDGLRVISVEGVTPSAETVDDGTYMFARPLFLYTSEDILRSEPQVAGFINYYLTHVNEEIEEVGYFPASDEALDAARQTYLDIFGLSGDELPEVDVRSLAGDIHIAGSSTVFPLTRRIADIFREEGFIPRLVVERGFQNTPAVVHSAGSGIELGDRVSLVEFFTQTVWQPAVGDFGVLPLVNATLMTSFIAMLVALPLGLGAAIYLSEYAPRNVRQTFKPILEILAGIPTVVYGYFALTFMTPLLRLIFGIETVSIYNTASAGIVVGILIIPLVSSMSEDALSAVPRALREASYGLGATKLETTLKVVIPAALSGIFAAFIVAISRAIGETMIVAIAAGAGPNFTFNAFESAETMTGHMARISKGDLSYDSIDYNSIYAIGLLLFILTLILNLISRAILARFREAY